MGFSPLTSIAHKTSCVAALLLVSQAALALGLGELQTPSRLGDRLKVEIALSLQGGERIDPGCIRLKKPLANDGLPWLRQGAHGIRRGPPAVLTIRADAPVFDPIIQIGVHIGCGYEIQRDYIVFLSPQPAEPELPVVRREEVAAPLAPRAERRQPRQRALNPLRADPERILPAPSPRRALRAKEMPAGGKGDRLVLFGGSDGKEPSLALSTDLSSPLENIESSEREAQREALRVEYRMLQALHQQAITLLETAEKLRQLEQTLSELQQRTDELARQGLTLPPESGSETLPEAGSGAEPPLAPTPVVEAAKSGAPIAGKPAEAAAGGGAWFYAGLILTVLLVGAWLLRRHWQNRRQEPALSRLPPDFVVDPRRGSELTVVDELDQEVGYRGGAATASVDVEFADTVPPPANAAAESPPASSGSISSHFSVASATVDEHFEVNPVMELADIMLSFGRVKGAAQALQEFVDHNPEEALQPWIRLMEVYRLAGMREEFERVAANLNQYFNVEVQNWDSAQPGTLIAKDIIPTDESAREEPLPIEWPSSAKKARSIEDMLHIRDRVIELWGGDECEPYLQTLLRDNRGGLRSGFTIEVVDEILFLIQIQETATKMAAEAVAAQTGNKEKV